MRFVEYHFVSSLHQLDPAYENVSNISAAQTEDTEEQEEMVWSPVRLEQGLATFLIWSAILKFVNANAVSVS